MQNAAPRRHETARVTPAFRQFGRTHGVKTFYGSYVKKSMLQKREEATEYPGNGMLPALRAVVYPRSTALPARACRYSGTSRSEKAIALATHFEKGVANAIAF